MPLAAPIAGLCRVAASRLSNTISTVQIFRIAVTCTLCHRREMTKPHYLALDGFRGIAALCVVVYHFHHTMQTPQLLPHAWLAVDFFFMLSGFVLMHAYKDRLSGSMSFGSYFRLRVRRLWPLILLGSAIAPLPVIMYHPELAGPAKLAVFTGLSSLLLPLPQLTAFGHTTFPLNTPLWSLSFEMLANVAFGLWAVKPSRWVPLAVAALSLVAIVLFTSLGGSLEGAGPKSYATFLMGIPRIGLPFALGMLLYKAQKPSIKFRGGFIVLSVLLVAVFAVPPIGGMEAVYEVVVISLGFPLLILVTAKLVISKWVTKVCKFLADLSYPIYALHWPLLLIAGGVTNDRSPAFYAITILTICGLSWAALKLFDEPVRARLSARFKQRASGRNAIAA